MEHSLKYLRHYSKIYFYSNSVDVLNLTLKSYSIKEHNTKYIAETSIILYILILEKIVHNYSISMVKNKVF